MLVVAPDIEHTHAQKLEEDDPSHQTEGLLVNLVTDGDIVDLVALVQDRGITLEADGNTADDVGADIPLNPPLFHHPIEVLVRAVPRLIVHSTEDIPVIHPNEQILIILDPIMNQAMLT